MNIPRVGEDEPVFILRAQDTLAESAIEVYGIFAASHGCQITEGLHKEIENFKKWQGNKKLPD